eukprot:CAMPEP_0202391242 /NCGR_PEP_ID=MMETSP1127-20130417/91733_1 /ASSEMBLY_ACC=CAM_ASM_000462 /TAXON_ID=3047 /ORGANISM="Dunaliella tertiolecta, Strain CCMP1320" /LENGTH=95 /DNA_ID=CAMNT_0048993663 /DNA_START=505 /DNA_END=792 /DNA_ORIENTATION=+
MPFSQRYRCCAALMLPCEPLSLTLPDDPEAFAGTAWGQGFPTLRKRLLKGSKGCLPADTGPLQTALMGAQKPWACHRRFCFMAPQWLCQMFMLSP